MANLKYKVGNYVLYNEDTIEKIINIENKTYVIQVIKTLNINCFDEVGEIIKCRHETYDDASRLLTKRDKLELL